MKTKLNKKGFTLIELIVVMAVIGILVLLAGPKFIGYAERAKEAQIQSNIKTLENAVAIHNIETEDWATKEDFVYTADELLGLGKKIYDKNGEIAELPTSSTFYKVDFEVLKRYAKMPNKNKDNFVVETTDGNVYFIRNAKASPVAPEEQKENLTQEQIDEINANAHLYFTYVNNDGQATITGLTELGKEQTILYVPETIEGVPVETIGNGGLTRVIESLTVKEIYFLEGTKTINPAAFANSYNYSGITFGDEVHSIQKVTLPSTLRYIYRHAFADCVSLKEITIPDNIVFIHEEAFLGIDGIHFNYNGSDSNFPWGATNATRS